MASASFSSISSMIESAQTLNLTVEQLLFACAEYLQAMQRIPEANPGSKNYVSVVLNASGVAVISANLPTTTVFTDEGSVIRDVTEYIIGNTSLDKAADGSVIQTQATTDGYAAGQRF